jgi:deoxyadenosine/deoxycytidine kinase
VVVSGAIGAGKSTAVDLLADALELPPFIEDFAANPFLGAYYADPARWAVQSQLFFLAQTVGHHRACRRRGGVQDHSVDEVRFAFVEVLHQQGVIDTTSYDLIDTLYGLLTADLTPPSLVVHLDAQVSTLQRRIRGRARPYEQGIDDRFLTALTAAKTNLWAKQEQVPVLWFNTDQHDLRTEAGRRALISQTRAALAALPTPAPTDTRSLR